MAKRQKKDHRLSSLSRRQGVREIKQSFLIVCEGEKSERNRILSSGIASMHCLKVLLSIECLFIIRPLKF